MALSFLQTYCCRTNYTGLWPAVENYINNALIPTIDAGYETPLHELMEIVERVKQVLDNPSEGICATVRVRIEQTAVLTRYAC